MAIKQIISITVRRAYIRFRACFLVALLAAGSIPAFADGTFNMNTETPGGSATGFSYNDGLLTIENSGTYTIEGSGSPVARHILIAQNLSVNITLKDVKLENSEWNGCAFEIGSNSHVRLILEGSNTLKSGYYKAGLQTGAGGSLEITAVNDTYSLTATSDLDGAGIGGSQGGSGENITISGGRVTATGGGYGAGIGGGNNSGSGKNITISGGIVTATGDIYGAGIGGGNNGHGENITISGGTVTAKGSSGGAGIGGGRFGAGRNITISGGTVRANCNSYKEKINQYI
jgi:hypothetical protein